MAGLCLALASCGRGPQLRPLHADSIVIAFGDSLTFGSGAGRESSYPAVLSRRLGIDVINAGVPGEVTADGLERLTRLLETQKPDLVILCQGGNDILRRVPAAQTEANLRQMVTRIRKAGADVVMIAVPQIGLLPAAAPFYERVADDLKVPLEDEVLVSLERNPSYKSDPIHLNAEGYRRLAEGVYELLRERGAVVQ